VLASEWAPYVRVNAIGPGYIETPLVKQVMQDKEWYENIRKQNMMQRFGKPEEILGPAVFLASDASSYITGFLLLPDAGWHCFGGWV
ncbi:MAG: SDR family oxidoreductase, partial [Syntrophobacteraceae bacterium]